MTGWGARRDGPSTVTSALLCCVLLHSVVVTADLRPSIDTQAAPGKLEGRQALQKAAVLVQQGRLEEADAQVRPALSDPDTRAAAHSVLGAIRLQQKRLEESARLLQEAIRLEPRLLGAHLTLAEVYTLQEKPALALGIYRRVLELDWTNAMARLALARSEVETGNYQRALEVARPALSAFKQSPEGLLVLATAFLKTGDRAAAAELPSDWARLTDVPQVWSIEFGLLLAREGAAAAAVSVLERARQTGPVSHELEFNLAGAYLLNKDPARALSSYDAALALKPDSLPALRQAAAVAEGRGELERALSYWMRARKIEPNDPEILLGFGRVCLRMDLLEDAEPALTKAASMKPEETAYQYTLAAAKVGKRQYRRRPGSARTARQEAPGRSAVSVRAGGGLVHPGASV